MKRNIVNPEWLVIYLNNFIDWKGLTTGGTIPMITKTQILNLEILLPSLEEQKKIAIAIAEEYNTKVNEQRNIWIKTLKSGSPDYVALKKWHDLTEEYYKKVENNIIKKELR